MTTHRQDAKRCSMYNGYKNVLCYCRHCNGGVTLDGHDGGVSVELRDRVTLNSIVTKILAKDLHTPVVDNVSSVNIGVSGSAPHIQPPSNRTSRKRPRQATNVQRPDIQRQPLHGRGYDNRLPHPMNRDAAASSLDKIKHGKHVLSATCLNDRGTTSAAADCVASPLKAKRSRASSVEPVVSSTYIDVGDCCYRCSHCSARFWYRERLKSSPANGPPLYHSCCAGGRILLPVAGCIPHFKH